MTTYLPATTTTFNSLVTFSSLDQLNESIKVAFTNFKSMLTKTSMRVLAHISTYSVKYLGVSFLSKQSIAEALNVNIRTVRRSIRQLEELGLIKSYRLKRVKGDKRETSSAIVITPLISTLPNCPSSKQDINLKDLNKQLDTEKEVKVEIRASKDSLIETGLVAKLPSALARAFSPFFNYDDIYKLVGVCYKAKASIDRTIEIEEYEADYYEMIIKVISQYKRGKVRNLSSLLYHAIKTLTYKISRQKYYGII